jgi:pyruvate/2-oxoglutarate dehydrogenase complex dihydrolipoamide dehydrogenase (E3) component
MEHTLKTEVCIIGAGSGGLSVAAGTAQLGLDTILIERDAMGGDCLNTGCVPSKALLAAAKRAHLYRKGDIIGIAKVESEIDYAGVMEHVHETIKAIEPNDSQQRFEGLGVHVIRESATLDSSGLIRAGEDIIKSRYVILATGSRPVVPPIPGINYEKVLTNESIFKLRQRPQHLLIIGGGPIGIEMAQAHKRLGSEVSVFDMANILPRDDKENVDILRHLLKSEGINLHEEVSIKEVIHNMDNVTLMIEDKNGTKKVTGSHLLVAAGRRPVTDGLGLDEANITYGKSGIKVDSRLRTSRKNIFAIGDVAGGPQFTHIAGYHAGIIIRNICFKIPAKTDYHALPWVTYTDPEIAQVGLTLETARDKYGTGIKMAEWEFNENDRAIAERTTDGKVRIITNRRGKLLGASLIGPHAGELSNLWALAISSGLKIGAVAGMIAPYPTLGEINKRVAGAWYAPSLFSNKTRFMVKLLQKLPI